MPKQSTRKVYCKTCQKEQNVPIDFDFKFWGECYLCHFDLPVEKKRRNEMLNTNPDNIKTYNGDDDEDS